jgi:hypothetical protein
MLMYNMDREYGILISRYRQDDGMERAGTRLMLLRCPASSVDTVTTFFRCLNSVSLVRKGGREGQPTSPLSIRSGWLWGEFKDEKRFMMDEVEGLAYNTSYNDMDRDSLRNPRDEPASGSSLEREWSEALPD